jgi:hypothetical protein
VVVKSHLERNADQDQLMVFREHRPKTPQNIKLFLTVVRTSQDQKSQAHGLGRVACVLTASGEKTSERGKKLSLLHLLSNLQ